MKFYLPFLISLSALLLGCAATRDMPSIEIGGVKIYSRENWHSLPIHSGYRAHQIKKITLHHGGVIFNGEKPTSQYLRNLQVWSRRERPWPDIPYHFIIDLAGKIWQGRPLQYAGDTNTEYDPTGHALIVLLGNYEVQQVSPRQLQAIIDLSVALCRKYRLDPAEIRGHKDYAKTTDCPGKNLYRYLADGTIVNEVKKRLR